MPLNVKGIILKYLTENNFDGLTNSRILSKGSCYCDINNLFWFCDGEYCGNCYPGNTIEIEGDGQSTETRISVFKKDE